MLRQGRVIRGTSICICTLCGKVRDEARVFGCPIVRLQLRQQRLDSGGAYLPICGARRNIQLQARPRRKKRTGFEPEPVHENLRN